MMPLRSRSDPSTDHQTRNQSKASTLVDDLEAAFIEFSGTVLFLLIAFGGAQGVSYASQSGTESPIQKNMYIAAVFGLSLLVSAWLFFRATGGLFNPNVSVALLLAGVITPVRCVLYCIAQLIGGIAAAGLVLALLPGPLASNTAPGPQVNVAQAVFIEMFITAALCLSVLMLGAEKHQATPFAPVGVGLTLFACHLFAIPFTGASMNTARAFGPAVVTGFHDGRHWVYWVGPFLGSLLATGFYTILKYFRYWRFNPGADSIHSPKSPDPSPSDSVDADVEAGRREKAPARA